MAINKITFSTSLEYANPHSGLRSWKKFGAEYEIIDNENLETAKKILKDFVYESLKQPQTVVAETSQVIESQQKKTKEENLIDAINTCTSRVIVESYAIIVKSYPENSKVRDAYYKKLEEFK